jgi:hypothetical protein
LKLFLRTYTNCENNEFSYDISARLVLALSHLSPEAAITPKPYWKMPDLYEFSFVLSPPNEVSFQSVIAGSPDGWSHYVSGNQLSSVWNRKQDQIFLIPEVSWAEIQLFKQISHAES